MTQTSHQSRNAFVYGLCGEFQGSLDTVTASTGQSLRVRNWHVTGIPAYPGALACAPAVNTGDTM
jgi:hypothetical protein